jgi:hypothetical protein
MKNGNSANAIGAFELGDDRAVALRAAIDAVRGHEAAGAGQVLDDDGRIAGDEMAEMARDETG